MPPPTHTPLLKEPLLLRPQSRQSEQPRGGGRHSKLLREASVNVLPVPGVLGAWTEPGSPLSRLSLSPALTTPARLPHRQPVSPPQILRVPNHTPMLPTSRSPPRRCTSRGGESPRAEKRFRPAQLTPDSGRANLPTFRSSRRPTHHAHAGGGPSRLTPRAPEGEVAPHVEAGPRPRAPRAT